MKTTIIEKAAIQFGNGVPVIQPLGDGIIRRTFKVAYSGYDIAIILKCINQRTFSQPENIIRNYLVIYEYLENKPGAIKIPAMVQTNQGKLFWVDEEDNFWRATCFVKGAQSLKVAESEKDAYTAARSFAGLTNDLSGLDHLGLNVILPDFHNLHARYQQFEESVTRASIMRLLRSTYLISELRQRKKLLLFYDKLGNESSSPSRLMHHDSKVNNILFDQQTGTAICATGLETIMPGKFFSDIGELIRTVCCPVDENSTAWEDIDIRGNYYFAIICGYLDGIGQDLTEFEKENLHYSGILMIYMQALRFVTDFLNNDIYYQTSYAEQNLNRAQNQFVLLEKLEAFLERKYHFAVYS